MDEQDVNGIRRLVPNKDGDGQKLAPGGGCAILVLLGVILTAVVLTLFLILQGGCTSVDPTSGGPGNGEERERGYGTKTYTVDGLGRWLPISEKYEG